MPIDAKSLYGPILFVKKNFMLDAVGGLEAITNYEHEYEDETPLHAVA